MTVDPAHRPDQLVAHRRQPGAGPRRPAGLRLPRQPRGRCHSRSPSPAVDLPPVGPAAAMQQDRPGGPSSPDRPRRDRSPGPAADLLGRQPAAGRRLRHRHARPSPGSPRAARPAPTRTSSSSSATACSRSATSTTLLIAPVAHPPTLVRPADRTVLEGESIHIPLQATDPDGDPLTYLQHDAAGRRYLDPNTGVFDWTPAYFQHGVYQVPFTVSDGQLSVTQTTTFTVLNVNAPPQFDYLGAGGSTRARTSTSGPSPSTPTTRASSRQHRTADGTLTPLDGTRPPSRTPPSACPPGATFDPDDGDFRLADELSDAGNYVVTFTATNDGDGTGMPLEHHGERADHGPQHQPCRRRSPFIPDQTVADGSVLTLPVQATDPDGDPLVLTAAGTTDLGLPSFATFVDNGDGTGTFTFAPASTMAATTRSPSTATDDGDGGGPGRGPLRPRRASSSRSTTPTRRRTSPPSATRSPSSASRCTFTIQATDADQDPLTFSALGLPAGRRSPRRRPMATAVFTWTPAAGDLGRSTRPLHGRRRRQRQSRRHPRPISSRSTSSSAPATRRPC